MIYLAARAVPRVSETDLAADSFSKRLENLAKKIPLEKADAWVSYWLERSLRQLKVVVLKLDNLFTKHLKNLKPSSQDSTKTLFEKKDGNDIQ